MNVLEQELRKLFSDNKTFSGVKFCGRACMGKLGENNRFKAELIICDTIDKYEAVKVTVLNKTDGVVDSLDLHFKDLLGRKKVNNPNFSDGVFPHIWQYNSKVEWYAYKPNAADYKKITESVKDYLDFFREPEQRQEEGQGIGMQTL